jgi:hypothetical protein
MCRFPWQGSEYDLLGGANEPGTVTRRRANISNAPPRAYVYREIVLLKSPLHASVFLTCA